MASQTDVENIKTNGGGIINDITKNLEGITIYKINLCFWKSIKEYENKHLDLTKRVIAYNKEIDNLFMISQAQQVETIYRVPIFNLQIAQIQNLLHEFASIISSKRMQFNFLCSLAISILAILISIVVAVVK